MAYRKFADASYLTVPSHAGKPPSDKLIMRTKVLGSVLEVTMFSRGLPSARARPSDADPPAGSNKRHGSETGRVRVRDPMGQHLCVIHKDGVVPPQRLGTLREPRHQSVLNTLEYSSFLTKFLPFLRGNAQILVFFAQKDHF